VCYGRIECVRNGVAKLVDVIIHGYGSNFTHYMNVRCSHIIEIY
jgi:hypothetical protein